MNNFLTKNIYVNVFILMLCLILANILQESNYNILQDILSLMIITIMIINIIINNRHYNIFITLFYFSIFSLYPRLLYDDSFVFINFFSGYYKIIIVFIFLISIFEKKIKFNFWVFLFLIIHLIAFFIGLVVSYKFNFFGNDLMYVYIIYSPLLMLFFPNNIKSHIIQNILFYFHSFSIAYVIYNYYIFFSKGIQISADGSLFVTFGPINLLVLIFLIYFSLSKRRGLKFITLFFLIVYLPFKILSINSQEIIVILMSILLFAFSKFSFKTFCIYSIIGFFLVVFINIKPIDTNNPWVDLKLNQLLSFIIIDNKNEKSNSLLIRSLEYDLLENQIIRSGYIVFGKGLGGVLENSNNLLYTANLHKATFPEEELNSGKIHGLHESIYKYLLIYGFLGFISILFIYYNLFSFNSYLVYYYDRLFFFTFLIMSIYYYGWSYNFLFIVNIILVLIINNVQNNRINNLQ